MRLRVTVQDEQGLAKGVGDAAVLAFANKAHMTDSALDDEGMLISQDLDKWIDRDGRITIEFDTDAQTARVVAL